MLSRHQQILYQNLIFVVTENAGIFFISGGAVYDQNKILSFASRLGA